MLTCLALALGVSLAELPNLATEVETEARALTTQTVASPALLAAIDEFAADSEQLSVTLREAGVEADLPCIFHGIAEDARVRADEIRQAQTEAERQTAFANLRVLLDDAILIAPMASASVQESATAP